MAFEHERQILLFSLTFETPVTFLCFSIWTQLAESWLS
jgi:hypothetical protein